jgi:hypothetical protein
LGSSVPPPNADGNPDSSAPKTISQFFNISFFSKFRRAGLPPVTPAAGL